MEKRDKKVLLIVFLGIVLLGLVIHSGIKNKITGYAVSDNNLVAYYKFESNANDYTGNHNGEVHGASFVSGEVGQALDLNGVDSYVVIPNDESLDIKNEITLSTWVYRKSDLAWGRILSKAYYTPESYNGSWLLTYGDNDEIRCDIKINGKFEGINGSKESLPLNKWTFVVCTYDGNIMNLYFNGELESTRSVSGLINSSNYNIYVGVGSNNEKYQNFFNGSVDEVRIYNKALNEREIKDLYEEDKMSSLVSYWKFNGNSDDSTSNHNGDVHGASFIFDDCISGSCLNFDGINDYVDIGNSNDFYFHNTEPYTISLWIKPEFENGTIISRYNENVLGNWYIGLKGRKVYGLREIAPDYSVLSNTELDFDKWYFITFVYNGENISIYINGNLDSTPVSSGSITQNQENLDLIIGARKKKNELYDFFNGSIDEVRIYKDSLSDSEIKTLYNEFTCQDSDGGDNASVSGITCLDGNCHSDYCDEKGEAKLTEYYCKNRFEIGTKDYDCPESCDNGACIKINDTHNHENIPDIEPCIDGCPNGVCNNISKNISLNKGYCYENETLCPDDCNSSVSSITNNPENNNDNSNEINNPENNENNNQNEVNTQQNTNKINPNVDSSSGNVEGKDNENNSYLWVIIVILILVFIFIIIIILILVLRKKSGSDNGGVSIKYQPPSSGPDNFSNIPPNDPLINIPPPQNIRKSGNFNNPPIVRKF